MINTTDPLKQARIDQLRFRRPIREIRNWLTKRDILPLESDIQIYSNYPSGYFAVVCVWNRVWIFKRDRADLYIVDIQPIQGFRENGMIIFS